ncbi:rhodanese-like domain-containing protein [Alicyclobacillus sp. SO9]|nr:rhodanese-like domain-containing protein [Alicyclobacillus sp. SO9]QQE81087.1 rhodanese-like domain-containing protein [Alicyclobacillus sp. SO9]
MSVDVKERIQSGKSVQIIDVREPGEFAGGHIPGAKLIPLGQIMQRTKEIDTNKETVVVCRSGSRSAMACQFLQQSGFKNVHNLMGGMMSWDGDIEY